MARYTGGMQVSGEHYWNSEHAQRRTDEQGGVEGNLGEPPPIPSTDPLAPVGDELDLLLRYLPSGIAHYAYGIARQVKEKIKQGAIELAATLQPGQSAVGEAHFTGRPGEEDGDGRPAGAEGSPELETLEELIAERKRRK